jgi:Na+/melibiose symporter-like transporter
VRNQDARKKGILPGLPFHDGRSGEMDVAGLVLGIIALFFAFMSAIGGFIAIPCLVVGLSLSAVAFIQKRREQERSGTAIVALVTNIVVLVLVIVAWLPIFRIAIGTISD